MLIVSLVDGREVRVPIRWFPRLLAGSAAARANLRITRVAAIRADLDGGVDRCSPVERLAIRSSGRDGT